MIVSIFLSVLIHSHGPEGNIADEIKVISGRIERIDTALKDPKVHQIHDPSTDRSAAEILEAERKVLVEKRYGLQMTLKYGEDAPVVISLEQKIARLNALLKSGSLWLHRAEDSEGRPAIESIRSEKEKAEEALREIKSKHEI